MKTAQKLKNICKKYLVEGEQVTFYSEDDGKTHRFYQHKDQFHYEVEE
jgi:hypothetical protein